MKNSALQIERHEIRVFDAIVTAQGFSRAAERLHQSQSAVSQTVANLEHKLGTQLLLRSRKPELTEAGRRFYTYARMLLNEEQHALEDIELIRTGALSTLSLATNSMVNRYFAKSLLLDFCEQNPLTKLKLDVVPSKEIIYGVDDERWELGFGPFQTDMPGHFETRIYFDEERILSVHKNHPRYPQLMTRAEEEIHNTVLLTSYLDEATKRPEATRLRSQFSGVWEVSNLEMRLALMEAGKGVTYLSRRVLEDADELVAIPGLPTANIPRHVGLYYKKHVPLSTGAARFVALCDKYFHSETFRQAQAQLNDS